MHKNHTLSEMACSHFHRQRLGKPEQAKWSLSITKSSLKHTHIVADFVQMLSCSMGDTGFVDWPFREKASDAVVNCEIVAAGAHTAKSEISESEVGWRGLWNSSYLRRVGKRMECSGSSAAREAEGFLRKYFGSQYQQLTCLASCQRRNFRILHEIGFLGIQYYPTNRNFGSHVTSSTVVVILRLLYTHKKNPYSAI